MTQYIRPFHATSRVFLFFYLQKHIFPLLFLLLTLFLCFCVFCLFVWFLLVFDMNQRNATQRNTKLQYDTRKKLAKRYNSNNNNIGLNAWLVGRSVVCFFVVHVCGFLFCAFPCFFAQNGLSSHAVDFFLQGLDLFRVPRL